MSCSTVACGWKRTTPDSSRRSTARCARCAPRAAAQGTSTCHASCGAARPRAITLTLTLTLTLALALALTTDPNPNPNPDPNP